MLKNFQSFFSSLLDHLLPRRSNFVIVSRLDEKSIALLPTAEQVTNAEWIHSLFAYRNSVVRALIWELKYKANTGSLDHIGRLLYDQILALISDISLFDSDAKFLLIPIPITQARRAERGYNQSEYIARAIVECDSARLLLYAPQWFEKIKDTATQSHSHSREERQHNLLDCFSAHPNVAGTYVVLIDDVVTTGSTLTEARRALKDAGARDVYAFTIAH